jgi:hypothetical protein
MSQLLALFSEGVFAKGGRSEREQNEKRGSVIHSSLEAPGVGNDDDGDDQGEQENSPVLVHFESPLGHQTYRLEMQDVKRGSC